MLVTKIINSFEFVMQNLFWCGIHFSKGSRVVISEHCETHNILGTVEIEFNENYFGASRVKKKNLEGLIEILFICTLKNVNLGSTIEIKIFIK